MLCKCDYKYSPLVGFVFVFSFQLLALILFVWESYDSYYNQMERKLCGKTSQWIAAELNREMASPWA